MLYLSYNGIDRNDIHYSFSNDLLKWCLECLQKERISTKTKEFTTESIQNGCFILLCRFINDWLRHTLLQTNVSYLYETKLSKYSKINCFIVLFLFSICYLFECCFILDWRKEIVWPKDTSTMEENWCDLCFISQSFNVVNFKIFGIFMHFVKTKNGL